ncbi:Winged helix-turn-helix transcription repressor DNA-binding [Penicillium cf. griseofulvum]|uniref:Winged helix-turn-helix transcription repressor DNA-binding n=1 Tax=Penicillium cf. griseofulvum TaxID=2972120 RepID=A0A9W9J2V3_9EURO|nr:Winged helix-turn-helix transcription repressor DNA-binding [Penicillium cf. griseofulvum]KAJ5434670.1 Winged helix-turn-helix transcription repressor DNA-binding [Penicillium cf. griseofulvum]KAJ5452499.1 Winged helix-turn-helix transcription repressor DNA-binding [Penicillium cf. griseofulvum]
MPRSEEAEWWANAVYGAIQEVPRGKVTSYGHIARLLGEPQRPRQVGVCLKALASPESGSHFNSSTVPWQRVINSKGMISHRGPGSAERQAEALAQEGVEVTTDSMGEIYVDFSRYGWFPSELPSELPSEGTGEQP